MSLGKVKEKGDMGKFDVQIEQVGRSGNSQLGEIVLRWLKEDLAERGPRNGQRSEGKTYESQEGIGGYGLEKRTSP
jgi:CCR4-NOT complex subunit CAF16